MSEQSRIRTVLQILGGMVGVALLGFLVYRLELQRDSSLLVRAGAKIAAREDGSLFSLSLHHLGLDSDQTSDAALEAIGQMTKLEELDLNCPITDDGLQHIADLENLEVLHFYDTKVTRANLDKLTVLTRLRVIHFVDPPLDDAGLMKAAELPVTDMALHWTLVTTPAIEQFKKLRPDVRINDFR